MDSSPDRSWFRSWFRPWDVVTIPLAFALDLLLSGVWDPQSLVRPGTEEPVPPAVVAALVVALAALLVLRRRYPVAVLVATIAVSALLPLLVLPAQPIACVLVALYAAASRGGPRRSALALALGLLQVVVIVLLVSRSYELLGTGSTAVYLLFAAALLFTSLVVATWGLAQRERVSHLRATRWVEQLDARADQAARDERHRIARELHDIVAHSVSAMMMQAAGAHAVTQSVARDLPEDQRVRTVQDALKTIEGTGSQSMRELHRLLGVLRDQTQEGHGFLDLDDEARSSDMPGLHDLDDLVEVPRRSGLIVAVHRYGEPGALDRSVDTAAYRVVQEALTNSLKHGGRGSVVDVYEAWTDDEVQVQVRCRSSRDAPRPATPSGGAGLRGLRERVHLAGGRFESGWAGGDFITTATLPTRPRTSSGSEAEHAGRP